ncbi:hypothetical protein FFWV33_07185 [Flavobacterium faecale]|uniref:NRDE family protein n=1 Tax=Flavobacterium faecale TaxID=1355330 RepID=A0A2S1LCA9_9FLAO|nr:NRDE family protein [Flavobacterium faecale]AWG21327.1 hypothetical protein FFWV33_07185 [Flavobacterium faecale]
MCTVSFVKTGDKVIITSNRDESVIRLSALYPAKYFLNNKTVLYPKDPKAGGTWYVVDEKGTVLVLLNGAQEKHVISPPYRKSRGLIVLDMIGSDSPIEYWGTLDLEAIEPFTLVLFQNEKLYQLRWNGTQKETTALDTNKSHIWASSTLYPAEVRQKRAQLFQEFLAKNQKITAQDLYQFHRYTDPDNLENGLVIDRDGALKTLSITQTVIEASALHLSYYDLIKNEQAHSDFSII